MSVPVVFKFFLLKTYSLFLLFLMLIHRLLLITSSVALETIEWLHLPAFALMELLS